MEYHVSLTIPLLCPLKCASLSRHHTLCTDHYPGYNQVYPLLEVDRIQVSPSEHPLALRLIFGSSKVV